MQTIRTKLWDRIIVLFSGAFSSCALFVKHGNEIRRFSTHNSMSKDWKIIGEDMQVAMYKLRKSYENKQKK